MWLKQGTEALTGHLVAGLYDALGDCTDDLKDVIRGAAERALASRAREFWLTWYPQHQCDIAIRRRLRPVRVNELRHVFEQLFGPEPEELKRPRGFV